MRTARRGAGGLGGWFVFDIREWYRYQLCEASAVPQRAFDEARPQSGKG